MNWTAKKRPQSVLGLTLAEGQLRAFQVARVKGSTHVVKSTTAALTLNLLHPEPELVGREIRNQLDAAGIHERRCVVAVPPGWLMSHHVPVPDVAPEDVDSFLQIEAEKAFPCDPAELQIARSPQRAGSSLYVTQLAVRKEQIDKLAAVLKAAGLKPVSFTIGLLALPDVLTGRITVEIDPKAATMLIAAGGGIAAFRTSESSIDSEAGENVVNGSAVARELRITLEQIPSDLRKEVREVHLVGEASMVDQLGETLEDWSRIAGLKVVRHGTPDGEVGDRIAQGLAARWLENTGVSLEFLPPRPSRWSALMARYSSRRLATAGFAVAGAAVLVLLAFGWQEYRRWSLRSQWHAMQAEVAELDNVQSRIREFRPWYDTGFRNLTILERVTECFPDIGSVTAKTVEIRNAGAVTITGTSRDNSALLKTLDLLRNARDVQGVKLEQIHGKMPQQFTFSFRWNSSSGS